MLRFSLDSFLRYETAIQTIVLNYPNVVTINPSPFSPETFTARCRDAIRWYLHESSAHFTSQVVDRELLRRVREDVVFVHDGTSVRVGPKHCLTSGLPTKHTGMERPQFTMDVHTNHTPSTPPRAPSTSNTHNPSEAQVLALLQDVSSGKTPGPIRLTGTVPVSIIESSLASGTFDCEYIVNPDGSVVIL